MYRFQGAWRTQSITNKSLPGTRFRAGRTVASPGTPPDNDCSDFIAQKMDAFATEYDNIVLIGDFNTDLTTASRKRNDFETVLQRYALTSIGEEPTFFHRSGCSQLNKVMLCRLDSQPLNELTIFCLQAIKKKRGSGWATRKPLGSEVGRVPGNFQSKLS